MKTRGVLSFAAIVVCAASCGTPQASNASPVADAAVAAPTSAAAPSAEAPVGETKPNVPEPATHAERAKVEVPIAPVAPRRLTPRKPPTMPPSLDPALTIEHQRLEGLPNDVVGFAPYSNGRWLVASGGARASVWLVAPAGIVHAEPRVFASGLDHPSAIVADGGRIFVLQRGELTELVDRDGDDVADDYRVVAELAGREFSKPRDLAVDRGLFAATFDTDGSSLAVVGSLTDGRTTIHDLRGARKARVAPGFDGAFLVLSDADEAGNRVHWIGTVPERTWSSQLFQATPDSAVLARTESTDASAGYLIAWEHRQLARVAVQSSPSGCDVTLQYAGSIDSDAKFCAATVGGEFAFLDAAASNLAIVRPTPGVSAVRGTRSFANGIELQLSEPLANDQGWEREYWAVVENDGVRWPDWVSVADDRRSVFLANEPGVPDGAQCKAYMLGDFDHSLWFNPLSIRRVRTQVGAELLRFERRPMPTGIRNALSEAEHAGGWRLLFDGVSTAGWRNYGKDGPVEGWAAENGELVRVGDGGDLVTEEEFASFELELDWRIGSGGNSGILFHVVDGFDAVWRTGPEMQILDNQEHPDGQNSLTSAGSNYALNAPEFDDTRPIGAWNHVNLLVDGAHVEHWLNGEKQCEYELWSDDWRARVAASKFAAMPDYGLAKTGRIALQNHGDRVRFKNVKVRPIAR
ncbi:MAG: DUF1080 domain-containing protein [Planctomycetes bacterium]|nr:DUF1080 domain-containing protein [Planctomycetota bacterium]